MVPSIFFFLLPRTYAYLRSAHLVSIIQALWYCAYSFYPHFSFVAFPIQHRSTSFVCLYSIPSSMLSSVFLSAWPSHLRIASLIFSLVFGTPTLVLTCIWHTYPCSYLYMAHLPLFLLVYGTPTLVLTCIWHTYPCSYLYMAHLPLFLLVYGTPTLVLTCIWHTYPCSYLYMAHLPLFSLVYGTPTRVLTYSVLIFLIHLNMLISF